MNAQSSLRLVVAAGCLFAALEARSDPVDEEETILDIMVLYTPEVRMQEGQSQVEGGVRLCMAYLNEAFRQSLIPARARLVHLGETVWHRGSGSVSDELGWLRADPVVADLRDWSLAAGTSLISNPFDNGDNSIGRVLPDLPQGTILFQWDESAQRFTSSIIWDGVWSPARMSLHPGEGAILWLQAPRAVHFTGMVQDSFFRTVPAGWSLQGVPFP
jgi:hypothetical protein